MSICQISIWPLGTCLEIGIEASGVWHRKANVAQEELDRVLEEVRNTENWCHFYDFTEQQKRRKPCVVIREEEERGPYGPERATRVNPPP